MGTEPKYVGMRIPPWGLAVRGRGKLYPLDGGGVAISEYDQWRPGSYENAQAGVLALGFCDDILTKLQAHALTARPDTALVTLSELKAEPQKRCDECLARMKRRMEGV